MKQINNLKIKYNPTYDMYDVISPTKVCLEEFKTQEEAIEWAKSIKDFTQKFKQEKLNKMEEIIEELGWKIDKNVSFGNDETGWSLSQYSPAGEDFFFDICINNDYQKLKEEIKNYAENFDEDEHIEMWIEAKSDNRCKDIPSAKILVKDAENIHQMLYDLSDAIMEV